MPVPIPILDPNNVSICFTHDIHPGHLLFDNFITLDPCQQHVTAEAACCSQTASVS